MSPVLPKLPVSRYVKLLSDENSVVHEIGEFIVEDIARFRQEKYPEEVYVISPRKIENKMKTAIGDSEVTKLKISRTILALTYGMSEEDFWWSRTRRGGRNYRIRATPDNLLFLRFRLRLI